MSRSEDNYLITCKSMNFTYTVAFLLELYYIIFSLSPAKKNRISHFWDFITEPGCTSRFHPPLHYPYPFPWPGETLLIQN